MEKQALARLGRENHLNNLISRLPVLTTIYGIQCLMVYHMALDVNIGDFSLYMAVSLIVLVGALFIHDKYHHILLYKDHILVYFAPLNTFKKIRYEDIKEIIVPEKECDFSSILLRLNNNQHIVFYFVDYPLQVKAVIEQIMRDQETDSSEAFDQAA
jgi:hypothetical protein